MSCISDKIAAINDSVVTVNCLFSRRDNSTCISLQFYKLDASEACLSASGLPVTCNIAQQRVVVLGSGEVLENSTGLFRYFLLCAPDRVPSSANKSRRLRLYAVDAREITLFREFRLPPGLQTPLSDLQFNILDGPAVCFVVQSDVYMVTSDGAVQVYPTGIDGAFQYLTSYVQDDYVLVVGLAVKSKQDRSHSQPPVLSLCIDTSKQLFGSACDALFPDVYLGIMTCLHVSTVSIDWTSVAAFDSKSSRHDSVSGCFHSLVVYVCTSYGQLVECRNGQLCRAVDLPFNDAVSIKEIQSSMRSSLFIVQSRSNMTTVIDVNKHQVLRQLEGVHTVLYGDFLGCGVSQVLFLPRGGRSEKDNGAADILSIVDAEMEDVAAADSFGRLFLLTDFSQVNIDRWNKTTAEPVSSMDGDSLLETMTCAANALQHRVAAGRSQLTAAMLSSDVKRAVIDNAITHMTGDCPAAEFTVPMMNVSTGQSVGQSSSPGDCGEVSVDRVHLGSLWQRVADDKWIVGVSILNRTSRVLRVPCLQLSATTNQQPRGDHMTGVSQCFTYLKRCLPVTSSDTVETTVEQAGKRVKLSDDSSTEVNYQQLFSHHQVKRVSSLMPRQDGHLVTMTDISRCRDIAFSGITCSVVATWRDSNDSSSKTVYRSCGQITLSAKDIINPQLGLMFNSSSVLSDAQTLEVLLSIHTLSSYRRTMLLKSTDRSLIQTSSSSMLTPVMSVLTEKLQFSVQYGCCLCAVPSSPLYLTCVEAAASPAGYNSHKLRLSAKTEAGLLLLMRLLYDHLPRSQLILPLTDGRLAHSVDRLMRSMSRELSTTTSDSELSTAQLQADTDSHLMKLLDTLS